MQPDGPSTDSQPQLPSGLQQAMSIEARHDRSVLQAIKLHVDGGPLSSGGPLATHVPPEHTRLRLAQF
jgi:hypothetical protein